MSFGQQASTRLVKDAARLSKNRVTTFGKEGRTFIQDALAATHSLLSVSCFVNPRKA